MNITTNILNYTPCHNFKLNYAKQLLKTWIESGFMENIQNDIRRVLLDYPIVISPNINSWEESWDRIEEYTNYFEIKFNDDKCSDKITLSEFYYLEDNFKKYYCKDGKLNVCHISQNNGNVNKSHYMFSESDSSEDLPDLLMEEPIEPWNKVSDDLLEHVKNNIYYEYNNSNVPDDDIIVQLNYDVYNKYYENGFVPNISQCLEFEDTPIIMIDLVIEFYDASCVGIVLSDESKPKLNNKDINKLYKMNLYDIYEVSVDWVLSNENVASKLKFIKKIL